ncbi:hypothetical protein BYI23_A021160 [Burkholderia sp. YI23]|nr:hypothetical protein BYI23_A021160 [Burkholderia sp. YI23]
MNSARRHDCHICCDATPRPFCNQVGQIAGPDGRSTSREALPSKARRTYRTKNMSFMQCRLWDVDFGGDSFRTIEATGAFPNSRECHRLRIPRNQQKSIEQPRDIP